MEWRVESGEWRVERGEGKGEGGHRGRAEREDIEGGLREDGH